jgi:hypothetical protein
MKEAYDVKEIPTKYDGKGSRTSCENCGKRLVMLSTYELTLKRNKKNA